jgi:hypothetical protein
VRRILSMPPITMAREFIALNKDAPFSRGIEHLGVIASRPIMAAFITNIAESAGLRCRNHGQG